MFAGFSEILKSFTFCIVNCCLWCTKQIAEKTNLPERTVVRIFSGDTDNPYVDTLHRIVTALGGTLDDILADTKVVVGSESLATLQESLQTIQAENERLIAENTILLNKVSVLNAENEIFKMKLRHKEEELQTIYDYYHKLKTE